jgi:hypothetical protein
MKIILLLITVLFLQNNALCQNKHLKVVDIDGAPLEFCNVYDTTNKDYFITNNQGTVSLNDKAYCLQVTRIGYRDTTINLNEDDQFTITLHPKETVIDEVSVHAELKFNNQLYEAGTYDHKSINSHHVYQKSPFKYGSLIVFKQHSERTKYINAVKFKMRRVKRNLKEDFNLVINLYAIHNGYLDEVPINKEPIVIKSNKIKNNNNITFSKPIILKKNSTVLVSFEIPKIGPDSKNTLIFCSNSDAEYPSLFTAPNFIKGWYSQFNTNSYRTDPLTKGYDELAVGLTYKILKD